MKKIAIALVAFGFATPALAQDEPKFTGPWVAAEAGWDDVVLNDGSTSGAKSGLLYGGALGYDHEIGGAVVGVEAELTGSTVKDGVNDLFVTGDRFELRAGRDIYVGGRIGAKVGKNILLYGKAGYTKARITGVYTSGATTVTDGTNEGGYRLGAGAEYGMGHMFARVEYRYSDYGDVKFQGISSGVSAVRHQIAVIGGFRF
jgi:outer membrane immunogenic protein